MKTQTTFQHVLLLSSYILFLFITTIPTAALSSSCEPDSCHALGPAIRFPFRLYRQPQRCGYPGFNLHCNSRNQTILRLPRTGEFVVGHIDYAAQSLFISDPGSCLARRILNFTLAGSAFEDGATVMRDYTFLNCSNDESADYARYSYMPLDCMSGRNHTVVASIARAQVPRGCRMIASVRVPMVWTMSQFYWSPLDMGEYLELGWRRPSCGSCEAQGGVCGFRGQSDQKIGCSRPLRSGLSRRARYGIAVGVGIPGLMCIVGLACYACGMLRTYSLRRSLNTELPTTVFDHRPTIRSTSGLDLPTIESYPKTMLGESRRLPNPSDKTCPICLSDYQPKETLRSIPECNHYFHADCIDEWLKLNGTCPLCRNSPDSSVATPCSSVLSSSSSSSMTTTPGQS